MKTGFRVVVGTCLLLALSLDAHAALTRVGSVTCETDPVRQDRLGAELFGVRTPRGTQVKSANIFYFGTDRRTAREVLVRQWNFVPLVRGGQTGRFADSRVRLLLWFDSMAESTIEFGGPTLSFFCDTLIE